ncbi:deoxynucleoside kinase [Patescibacteria group bacterium]|nr:deoxynucleoside kinase [Patescibacteria group bacterium]
MKYFIAIAGNIGAGKSSLAKKLSANLGWELFQEPFCQNPYLENFYEDMRKWAFHCETAFFASRISDHFEILKKENSIIQDRCIYEGAEIFVKNLYRRNHLSETDWQTYKKLYDSIVPNLQTPDLIIFLQSSVERCLSHIKKRERGMETAIDREYIENLNYLYEEWEKTFSLCPIFRVDADKVDLKYNEIDFKSLLQELKLRLPGINQQNFSFGA